MEATITLSKTAQNPEGRILSFNSEMVCNLVLTSHPDGTATVTLRVTPELEEAYIRTLKLSMGVDQP